MRFGATPTAHQARAQFADGVWGPWQLEESGPLALSPRARALHYGQSVFEGLKAHPQPDGSLAIFRLDDHLARLARSCERMCIPPPPLEAVRRATIDLVAADSSEAPPSPGSLYVRPFVFASQADFTPIPAEEYTAMVMLAPVEGYFAGGVSLVTETTQARATPGGTGAVKAAGNYAAAMHAQRRAREAGYDEVVWLDAREGRFVEETGAMNLMLVHGDALVTPPLGDTLLAGITRDSLLTLARDAGIGVREERVPIDEPGYWEDVREVFSSGTAAGTTHVRAIDHEGRRLFERDEPGPISRELGERLAAVQRGEVRDPLGWRTAVPARPAAG